MKAETESSMLYIGALAKLTGVSHKAIRHYEALGLIPPPQRKGRYRIYNRADADLICMIKRAQSLGFTLKEIAGVVSRRAKTRTLPLEMTLQLIAQKRKELRAIIANAQSQEKELEALEKELCTRVTESSGVDTPST